MKIPLLSDPLQVDRFDESLITIINNLEIFYNRNGIVPKVNFTVTLSLLALRSRSKPAYRPAPTCLRSGWLVGDEASRQV